VANDTTVPEIVPLAPYHLMVSARRP